MDKKVAMKKWAEGAAELKQHKARHLTIGRERHKAQSPTMGRPKKRNARDATSDQSKVMPDSLPSGSPRQCSMRNPPVEGREERS